MLAPMLTLLPQRQGWFGVCVREIWLNVLCLQMGPSLQNALFILNNNQWKTIVYVRLLYDWNTH